MTTKTMMETRGYDIEREGARRKQEEMDGTPSGDGSSPAPVQKGPGRPEMDDTERNSDKDNGMTASSLSPAARQPDGSLQRPEFCVKSKGCKTERKYQRAGKPDFWLAGHDYIIAERRGGSRAAEGRFIYP